MSDYRRSRRAQWANLPTHPAPITQAGPDGCDRAVRARRVAKRRNTRRVRRVPETAPPPRRYIELAQLGFGACAQRKRFCALKSRFAAQLVDQLQRLCAAGADAGPKRRMHCFARIDPHTAPQRQHRIEHGAHGIGKGLASMMDAALRTSCPRPRNRARSVSNCRPPMASPSSEVKCAIHSCGWPGLAAAAIASSAPRSATNSVCTNIFENAGCAESAAAGLRTTSEYDVSSISRTPRPSLVSDKWRTSASSSGRHEDLHDGADRAVLAAEFRTVCEEGHLVDFRFPADGLVACRPDVAVEYVAQENVEAPGVAGGILAPARQRQARQRLYPEPAAVSITE